MKLGEWPARKETIPLIEIVNRAIPLPIKLSRFGVVGGGEGGIDAPTESAVTREGDAVAIRSLHVAGCRSVREVRLELSQVRRYAARPVPAGGSAWEEFR